MARPLLTIPIDSIPINADTCGQAFVVADEHQQIEFLMAAERAARNLGVHWEMQLTTLRATLGVDGRATVRNFLRDMVYHLEE